MRQSRRLSYVPLGPEWVDPIYKANLLSVRKRFQNSPSRKDVADWIAETLKKHPHGVEEYLVLKDGLFAGTVSLRTCTDGTGSIGMWVVDIFQRRGYSREIFIAAVDHLKAKGVRRIVYEVEDGNKTLLSLAMSAGMELVKSYAHYHLFRMDLEHK